MTVSKGFFDQYSVFCVFGSVVGCVVVPLITQSMECMILSAIVISLTAAHLNKKASESTATKIVVKEGDKKKVHHQGHKKKSNVQLKESARNDDEYVQQFEHLKLLESERRLEEKKQRKSKKREEKLRRREEELKKQQDLERKLTHCSQEKRPRRLERDSPKKQQDSVGISPWSSPGCSLDTLETSGNAACYMQRLSSSDESRRRFVSCQRIPRFERQKLSSVPNSSMLSSTHVHTKPWSNPCVSTRSSALTIRCPSLSSSCSSLSSVGTSSWSEPSNSPPLPKLSTPPPQSPWKLPRPEATDSPLMLMMAAGKEAHIASSPVEATPVATVAGDNGGKSTVHPLMCYTNVLPTKGKAGLPFDSFSLFCSSTDSVFGKNTVGYLDEEGTGGAEYSLFGPARFSTAIIKNQGVM